jgi:hypothetical protein
VGPVEARARWSRSQRGGKAGGRPVKGTSFEKPAVSPWGGRRCYNRREAVGSALFIDRLLTVLGSLPRRLPTVDAWADLPEAIKAGMLAMVRAAGQLLSGGQLRVDDDEFERRMTLCRACDQYRDGRCAASARASSRFNQQQSIRGCEPCNVMRQSG